MLLTFGYIGVASVLFAALSLSPLELFGFPVVIALWTGYLWVLTARSIRSFSMVPRAPARVIRIIVVSVVVALAALVTSIVCGLLIVAGRS